MRGENAFELFRQSFDLLGGHILTRHIDKLVKSHDEPFFPVARNEPTLSPSSPERLDTDLSKAGTRETGLSARQFLNDPENPE
jgi:hypothetical protein